MSELITRTARLIPYSKRPKQVPSYVTAYMYEPEADEPTADLGNLYIVIEVLVTGRASEEVADLVIEAFSDHYYNQAHEKTPLERFESAIKSTNHQLAEFINQGNAAWIGKMSAVVAVVAGAEIHLCQTGSADAYLYRGRAHTRIISPSTKPAQPSKTFSSIASGTLEAEDKLLFTTPALVHQIALSRLHSIISSHNPNAAIAELTAHLPSTGSERIGVLVLEITTPELAALQIRSDEPNEIKLGQPENTFEAVKLAATPVAQSALSSSRKAHSAASATAGQLKPHISRAGLAAVRVIREQLAGKRGGRKVLLVILVLLIVGGIAANQAASARELKALKLRYSHDYQLYVRAQQQADGKDTATASASLDTLRKDLASLKANHARKKLEAALAKDNLPSGEPRTIDSFIAQVNTTSDSLLGLKHVTTTTVANLPASANNLELSGTVAYTVSENGINIVNISTKSVTKSKSSTANLGQIISTALSSGGDGIFILTKAPSVWFYRFDNDSLSEITLGGSAWETGTAIASYNANIYILSDGVVYKHVKTITGYSPKTIALSKDTSPQISAGKGLGIDGIVYTVLPNTLQGFLAGVPQPPLTLPSDISTNPSLKVINDWIVIADRTSNRIGLISTKATPVLSSEYSIKSGAKISDAAYDSATNRIYVIDGTKLVSFDTR